MPDVVVVGQIGRDLVLGIDRLPPAGGSGDVVQRREMLGGKGANQAVGLRQLGASVGLVGAVGADGPGDDVLNEAGRDGIDITGVVRRPGAATALLVDVVEPQGVRRLLEHVPADVLLRPEDVRAAEPLLRSARLVLLQLQQPGPAVVEALGIARQAGARVVADGAPADDDVRQTVLTGASVIRADDSEAALLMGRELDGVPDAVEAAAALLGHGPDIVALAVGTDANVVAWRGGHAVLPLLGGEPVDPTGGGDAFVAGLSAALLRGDDPESAGWFAAAAAAAAVAQLGGRPDLDVTRLDAVRRPGTCRPHRQRGPRGLSDREAATCTSGRAALRAGTEEPVRSTSRHRLRTRPGVRTRRSHLSMSGGPPSGWIRARARQSSDAKGRPSGDGSRRSRGRRAEPDSRSSEAWRLSADRACSWRSRRGAAPRRRRHVVVLRDPAG